MLVSVIRDRAFRMLLGRTTTPAAGEATRALEAFQSLTSSLPGTIGIKWVDVYIEANYTAGEDERIFDSTGALTITLPTLCYLSGEGVAAGTDYSSTTMRPPLDGARVQIVDAVANTATLHFYRADRAEWMSCEALAAADESPLPAELDRFLPAMLAVELQAEYGADLSPLVLDLNDKGWRQLRAKYGGRKAVAVESALLINSTQTNSYGVEVT
jgi:hypothetical protein